MDKKALRDSYETLEALRQDSGSDSQAFETLALYNTGRWWSDWAEARRAEVGSSPNPNRAAIDYNAAIEEIEKKIKDILKVKPDGEIDLGDLGTYRLLLKGGEGRSNKVSIQRTFPGDDTGRLEQIAKENAPVTKNPMSFNSDNFVSLESGLNPSSPKDYIIMLDTLETVSVMHEELGLSERTPEGQVPEAA